MTPPQRGVEPTASAASFDSGAADGGGAPRLRDDADREAVAHAARGDAGARPLVDEPTPAARPRKRDAWTIAGVGLLSRLAVVAWAARSIPPAADGTYYDRLATRIAEGHGYTWLWPDGVVTYAAHYPVGYPALVGLGYALFGAHAVVAMLLNAIVGTLAGVAAWSLVARATSPRLAFFAGIAVALHPVLVPYTAAIMTEGVTTSLLVAAAAVAAEARARASWRWLLAAGVVVGLATLVRPQSLALAPVLGWLAVPAHAPAASRSTFRLDPPLPSSAFDASSTLRQRLWSAAVVAVVALVVCAPWTARNCVRMNRCSLVSVNGGWNLAIGAQTETGAWQEIAVPDACATVFEEAAKDACFGREATRAIARDPARWLARVPAKLRATFDYFGAAPWYLHTANAERFPWRAKVVLASIETLGSRLLLAAALVSVGLLRPARDTKARTRTRKAVVGVGLVACVLVPGAIAYLALGVAILALGRRNLRSAPLLLPFTAALIFATAATHAVFFGAGRYGIVVVPFVAALAFLRLPRGEVGPNEAG